MDRDAAISDLRKLLDSYLPDRPIKYGFRFIDALPEPLLLGKRLDPLPFTGLVIGVSEKAIFITSGMHQFEIVDRAQVTMTPPIGDYVEVAPYSRRNFDGTFVRILKLGEAMAIAETLPASKILSYDGNIELPIQAKHSDDLAGLILQLEMLPAPDGFRSIAHLLVDAGASDFELNDPDEHSKYRSSPSISFSVKTNKYHGRVQITYDRGRDYYIFELYNDGQIVEQITDVCWEDLADILADKVDDGEWRQIKITPIKLPVRCESPSMCDRPYICG